MHQRALHKAIRYFGSQKALAKALGIGQSAINHWLNRERSIPYKQVLKIVAATRGHVTQYELAPDEKKLNQIVDELIHAQLSKLLEIPIEKIRVRPSLHHATQLPLIQSQDDFSSVPLIVDSHFCLLTCDCELRLHQQLGHRTVLVRVIPV